MNLPKRNGTEVLQAIRNSEALRNIAVFVLSSSPSDVIENKVRSANVEADSYFVKPYEFDTFGSLAAEIQRRFEMLAVASQPLVPRASGAPA